MARRRDYKSQPVLTPFPHSPLYFITNNRFPSQVMACAVIAILKVKSHLWRHKNAKKDRNFESQSICSTRFQELFKTWAASFWLFSKLTVREHCKCVCVCVSVHLWDFGDTFRCDSWRRLWQRVTCFTGHTVRKRRNGQKTIWVVLES